MHQGKLATPTSSTPRVRPGWEPAIDPDRCTGCGWCVAACAPHVLALEASEWRKRSRLQDATRCTGCSDCAVTCPFHAITMVRASRTDLTPRD